MPNSKPPVRTRRIPQPQDPAIAVLRVDHERIYQAIDQRRRRQRLRWNEIAAMLGVSSPAVTGWGRGTGLSATHLARALAWLDRPLTDFVTPEPAGPWPETQDATSDVQPNLKRDPPRHGGWSRRKTSDVDICVPRYADFRRLAAIHRPAVIRADGC